jgi:two-component system nitrate/nitrite response regulator NarL
MSEVQVLVSDPSQLFREGVVRLLQQSRFSVIASAKTLAEAAHSVSANAPPELLIFGVGNEVNAEASLSEFCSLRADFADLRAIMLAGSPDGQLALRAAAAGVDALLSKDISGTVLVRSAELVMLGQQLFPAVFSSAPVGNLLPTATSPVAVAPLPPPSAEGHSQGVPSGSGTHSLSDREAQILRRLSLPNKVIAHELGMSEATVKVHVRTLLRKLGATNRTQAALIAARHFATRDRLVLVPSASGRGQDVRRR